MESDDAAGKVEAFFVELERTVFTGDMAANMSLHVEVVEAREVAGGVVVAAIAPWTIAFILLFDDPFPDSLVVAGRSVPVLVNEVPVLGRYRSVTPIVGVELMDSQDTARTSVSAVIEPLCDAITRAVGNGAVENPARRALFRTLSTGDPSPDPPVREVP